MNLKTKLANISSNVSILEIFLSNHPDLHNDSRAFINLDDEIKLYLVDAALAGQTLGKTGWTRQAQYTKYNWIQDFACSGRIVQVTIIDAEPIETQDKTPVPPRIFPLALKDTVNAEDDGEPFF